jgi:hypothetical protein
MEMWKVPETTSFLEAHNKQRAIDPATRRQLIQEKQDRALADWARRRMGSELEHYLDLGLTIPQSLLVRADEIIQ